MEEKSIYDFIEDNLNINDKKGRSWRRHKSRRK